MSYTTFQSFILDHDVLYRGVTIKAPMVISAVGIWNTYNKLIPASIGSDK